MSADERRDSSRWTAFGEAGSAAASAAARRIVLLVATARSALHSRACLITDRSPTRCRVLVLISSLLSQCTTHLRNYLNLRLSGLAVQGNRQFHRPRP